MPSARPETRYAKSGDVNIAYQVVGEGPLDLIYVPGWISNLELMWDEPALAHVLDRFASFSRLILFDKRGTGLSDPVPLDRLPTLEERMDDVRAVLDAVECEQAAVFGFSEGGLMSVLFAATYPERTTALVLYGVFAKRIWSPDYPWAPKPDDRAREIDELERNWAERMDLDKLAPVRGRRIQGSYGDVLPPQREPRRCGCTHADEHPARRARRPADDPGADPRSASEGRPRFERRGGPLDRGPDPRRQVRRAARRRAHALGRRHGQHRRRDRGVPDRRPARSRARSRARDGPLHRHRRLDGTSERGRRPPLARAARAASRARAARSSSAISGREVDTAGDGFFATFDGPARAIRCASAIRRRRSRRSGSRSAPGVHTGECELTRRQDRRVRGAHRAPGLRRWPAPGEVLVSHTVKDLVAGSGLEFEDRGAHELKGVPGEWRLYAVGYGLRSRYVRRAAT